jgi:hypothetical protein
MWLFIRLDLGSVSEYLVLDLEERKSPCLASWIRDGCILYHIFF